MNLAILVDNTQFWILMHASCAHMMARTYQGGWQGAFIFVDLDKQPTNPRGCNLFAEYLMGTS